MNKPHLKIGIIGSRMRGLTAMALAAILAIPAMAQSVNPSVSPTVQTNGSTPITIKGTAENDYNTRQPSNMDADGVVNKNVKDVYNLDLTIANSIEIKGQIGRLPNLTSHFLGRVTQSGQLYYDLGFIIHNSSRVLNVGKWVGTVPMTIDGQYCLEGQPPLMKHRIAIDSIGQMTGFEDSFGGRLIGKGHKTGATPMAYFRELKGKEVKVEVKNVDPMRFQNIILAKGPASSYPRTTVNGSLDYDYETGNWMTNGIRMTYTLNGREVEDVITGSIKWVQDQDYDTSGKGYYQFNLRYNEAKTKPVQDESAALQTESNEDAFFAVDNTVPAITGNVTYQGQMISVRGQAMPAVDKVTYDLTGNGITKLQAVNFVKLWLICVGPTNDE